MTDRRAHTIESQLEAIQRSSGTTFRFFARSHNYLRMKVRWYYEWHLEPWASAVHIVVAWLFVLFMVADVMSTIYPATTSAQIVPTSTPVSTYTPVATPSSSPTASPTPTPTSTAAPAPVPTVTFSASPATVTVGAVATLSWQSANATTVSIDNGVGVVALSGNRNVQPSVTTKYTLTAQGSGGTASATVTVTVVAGQTIVSTASPTTISATSPTPTPAARTTTNSSPTPAPASSTTAITIPIRPSDMPAATQSVSPMVLPTGASVSYPTPLNPSVTTVNSTAAKRPASLVAAVTAQPVLWAVAAATAALPLATGLAWLADILSDIPTALRSLWLGLSAIFLRRRKRMPWGRVIDSQTETAVPGAVVTVHDRDSYGRVAGRALSDRDGRFAFLVNPGRYSLWVKKPGYRFPSQINLKGYHGATFTIGPERMVVLDLIVDRLSGGKRVLIWLRRLAAVLDQVRLPLLAVGSLVTAFLLIKSVTISIAITALIYVALWVREVHQRHLGRHTLLVVDALDRPLPFAPIRLLSKTTGNVALARVTDDRGELYVLVPPGDYTARITNPKTHTVTDVLLPLPKGVALKQTRLRVR